MALWHHFYHPRGSQQLGIQPCCGWTKSFGTTLKSWLNPLFAAIYRGITNHPSISTWLFPPTSGKGELSRQSAWFDMDDGPRLASLCAKKRDHTWVCLFSNGCPSSGVFSGKQKGKPPLWGGGAHSDTAALVNLEHLLSGNGRGSCDKKCFGTSPGCVDAERSIGVRAAGHLDLLEGL